MREFVSVESLFEDTDFCSKFCENCPAKIHKPATLESPEKWECLTASWEFWSKDCLRYDDAARLIEAFNDLNLMIEKCLNN